MLIVSRLKSNIKFGTCIFFAVFISRICAAEDATFKHLESALFAYSTDERLMTNVELVGTLENGMAVHSWEWSKEANALDERYGALDVDGTMSGAGGFAPIGLLTSEVSRVYPNAVFVRQDGYEQIISAELGKSDHFIRALLSSTEHKSGGRCARIQNTRYTLCF